MRTGRPTKIDDDVIDAIEDALRLGMYPDQAAAAAGVSRSTYYAWLERGRAELARLEAETEEGEDAPEPLEEEAPYVAFLDAVEKALGVAERNALRTVATGAQGWQGSAWILERRFRDRWGRTTRTEVTGADGGPVAIASASVEEIEALAASLMNIPTDTDDETAAE